MLRGNGAPAELKQFCKVTDSVALYVQVSGGRHGGGPQANTVFMRIYKGNKRGRGRPIYKQVCKFSDSMSLTSQVRERADVYP